MKNTIKSPSLPVVLAQSQARRRVRTDVRAGVVANNPLYSPLK